jgi:hypothetical protein
MASFPTQQTTTREHRLATRLGFGALLLVALSQLADRWVPALETPLQIATVAVFGFSFYYRAVDPGPPRRVGDGA